MNDLFDLLRLLSVFSVCPSPNPNMTLYPPQQGRPMSARKLTVKKNSASKGEDVKGKMRAQTQRARGEEAGGIDWNGGDGDLGSIYEEMQAVQRELRQLTSSTHSLSLL